MRRLVLGLCALALVGTACAPNTQDTEELRRALSRSDALQRSFTFHEASQQRVFTITGAFEDDFRYRMTLAADGGPFVEQVVSDDALAIRLLDPERAGALGNVFGHPDVERALREGRWVVDPSGAPPLSGAEDEVVQEQGTTGDPFVDALESMTFVTGAMSEAATVREFNLEDIQYRPALDPWRYPRDDAEKRYDLIRPALPQNEEALIGAQGDITESSFRKTSVFVDPEDDRVTAVCSLVDIRGHEDYIELQEAGGRGNAFHRDLFQRILEGGTTTRIAERERFITYDYAPVSIELPSDAHIGKLTEFKQVLTQAFQGGFLAQRRVPDLRACDRAADEQ